MRSSPNELARIAALVLSNLGNDEKRLAMLGVAPPCEGGECPMSEKAKDEARRSLDAVGRVALSTRDPRVYALAFGRRVGRVGATAGACQIFSAEQRSRLDPGNAAPWLHMLDAVAVRGDVPARDESLFRIANAQRNDADLFSTAGAVLDTAPDDDASVLASWGLVTKAISAAAAGTMPPYQAVMAMCKGDGLEDANRLQTCAAVAAKFQRDEAASAAAASAAAAQRQRPISAPCGGGARSSPRPSGRPASAHRCSAPAPAR